MININKVSKKYGNFCAVQDLNLNIGKGKIFAFLGTNGAGKTTTIRMLTGILRPTEGKILIDGHCTVENSQYTKSICGYIPDRPYIYPKLTAYEFLNFIGGLYNLDRKQCEEDSVKLLEDFGLGNVYKWI